MATDFFAFEGAAVLPTAGRTDLAAVVLASLVVLFAGFTALPALEFAATCVAADFAAGFDALLLAAVFRVAVLAVPPPFNGIRALAMPPPPPRGPGRNDGLDSTPDLQAG
ncbi:hypothetical protein MQC88_01260 [Luteimonas sp. 50]|uniref:Uncharacterized protein n=1 Tax=Cognatiluteimonas sedimenti TaxID=2927791 RepID=A0ABT0A0V4_9GAMM|nr:hypothetical protein [Lysobacter sedimenti]MCJ0824600.1 hypothetical protein [Lysobacter sedimenti]